MGEFTNKVVVVTGGNSGIGRAIAEKFDREGAKVAIFGRDQNKLNKVAGSLKNAIAVQGDVTKIADLDRLFKETKQKLGNVDVLVANAGVAEGRHVKDVDEKFFDSIVSINYKGLYFTVQRSIPFLNPEASIILISSVAAHIGLPSHGVYSSTKAAVTYLAKTFSADLVAQKVRVNVISPGFVDTPIFDTSKKEEPQIMERLSEIVPVKRFGKPEEIAEAALFLGSNRSSYIVGADIVIDGGLTSIFPHQI